MRINEFGWNMANGEQELLAVKEFFGETADGASAEKLRNILYAEIDRVNYDEQSVLDSEQGKLSLRQKAEKQYYHDGAEQARKVVTVAVAEESEKAEFEEVALGEEYLAGWLDLCTSYFSAIKKGGRREFGYDPVIFAENFLGVPLVKISISHT